MQVHDTKDATYFQWTAVAWYPRRTTYEGWVWLRRYWGVSKSWGWGFLDEWTFKTFDAAETFFQQSKPR